MSSFVTVVACFYAFAIVTHLRIFSKGNLSGRINTLILDTFIDVGMLSWAIWLLAKDNV